MGIHKLSDCLLMVKEFQDAAESSSLRGNLLSETKKALQLFGEYQIQHVNRFGNEAAIDYKSDMLGMLKI